MANTEVETAPGLKQPRRKRDRYAKISLKARLVFFRKVIHEHADLRDIARKLGIKYSTAKTLTRNYKAIPEETNTALVDTLCAEFDHRPRARRRCSYRMLEEQTSSSAQAKGEEECVWAWELPKIEIICNSIAQE